MQGVWKSFQPNQYEAAHVGRSQAANHRVQGKIWAFSTCAGWSVSIYRTPISTLKYYQEVWHACNLCGQLVLLDNDHLGRHIRLVHKGKVKEYKEQYMIVKKYCGNSLVR